MAAGKLLYIGRRNFHHVYALNGVPLEETQAERDMGVYMDTYLEFQKQAASAVSKTSQGLAVAQKSFLLLDKPPPPGPH